MWLKDSCKQLCELLPRWNRFIGRAFKGSLPEGMSPPMHYLLAHLCEPVSMTVMARRLGMSKQQLTPLADKLIAMDLVRRVNDPNDRRLVLLEATEKAESYMAGSVAKTNEYFGRMFEEMGEENEARFTRAMSEINAIFIEMQNRENQNRRKESD